MRTAIADLNSSVLDLQAAVVELTEFVLSQHEEHAAGSGLFVVDSAGQTLGPAGLLSGGKARTVIDVAGVGQQRRSEGASKRRAHARV